MIMIGKKIIQKDDWSESLTTTSTVKKKDKEKDNIVKWKQILKDTSPNLDLEFVSQVQPSYSVRPTLLSM